MAVEDRQPLHRLRWAVVLLATGAFFAPLPVERLVVALVAFPFLWVGFSLVFPGSSAIVKAGKGFVGAILIAALAGFVSGMISTPSSTLVANAEKVELATLLSAYHANEVAADQQYKGHVIETHGIVQDVKKDIGGTPFVIVALSTELAVPSLQCSIADAAVGQASQMTPGQPVTVQGRVAGLMLNVQARECAFVAQPVPTTTPAPVPTATTAPAVAPVAAVGQDKNLAGILQTVARLATVPLTDGDGSARDWSALGTSFPASTWTPVEDKEHAFAKQVFIPQGASTSADDMKPGLTITVRGARTMILQTEISIFGSSDTPLVDVFQSAVSPTVLRCQSEEGASGLERWYRFSLAGMKPLVVSYMMSGGSAGVTESLTFDRDERRLPTVGSEAMAGTWTDKCQR